jgi:transcription antitermination protein NusB
MARRRQAREAAFQLLFQHDINPETTEETARETLGELLPSSVMREFAWQLYKGTLTARDALDAQIEGVADNWELNRMAATDRNLVRMGIFEMQTIETAAAVVIDECIELAKEFGGKESGKFVNGILDQLNPTPSKPLTEN